MPRTLLLLFATTALLTNFDAAQAQTGQEIVGLWTLVSNNTTKPDGTRNEPFGSDPEGLLIFDGSGRYSLQICRAGRLKFKSNNRLEGTADENKEVVQSCNPHWGRYTVNDGAIVFKIEGASYGNWKGLEQKRPYTVSGDQLKYTVPAASTGGVSELVWRRAN
jgi:hypothetical protein